LIIEKLMVGAAVVLSATVVTATPADADPSQFGTLSCSCAPATGIQASNPDVKSQVDQGIQQGLDSLHGNAPGPGF
jgi:hypothetical protein